jgi:hypothetical protein
MFFFSARVGALIPRIGEFVLLSLGATLAGAGFLAFALLDHQQKYVFGILPGVLLLGAGMTCAVAPLTTAVMSSVPERQTGIASAVNNALSRLAGLLAVSLLSLVLAHGFAMSLRTQLDQSALPSEVRSQIIAGRSRLHDAPIPAGLTKNQRATAMSMLDTAFLSGFRLVMFFCAFGSWAGALAVFVLLRKPGPVPDQLDA